MEKERHKKFRKDMKDHTRHCWKCGNPKRKTCKNASCTAQHCACAMTDSNITD